MPYKVEKLVPVPGSYFFFTRVQELFIWLRRKQTFPEMHFFFRFWAVKVGIITPYPVYRNVPFPVKQIVKVPIHIPHAYPVERKVSPWLSIFSIKLQNSFIQISIQNMTFDSRTPSYCGVANFEFCNCFCYYSRFRIRFIFQLIDQYQ